MFAWTCAPTPSHTPTPTPTTPLLPHPTQVVIIAYLFLTLWLRPFEVAADNWLQIASLTGAGRVACVCVCVGGGDDGGWVGWSMRGGG